MRTDVQRTEIREVLSRFAAEAAARHLPLKRQCTARLRAGAEPRVYPRTSEAAMLCPFTGSCRAAGLPAHISATLLVDEDDRPMRTVVRSRRSCDEDGRAADRNSGGAVSVRG